MRALVYTGARTLEIRELPEPRPEPEEALVRVSAAGICGSDMHAWAGHDDRRPAPLILGHEAAGEVQSGWQRGKRVTINPLVTCMACEPCLSGRTNLCASRQIISMPPREGAFADSVVIPKRNLIAVPDETTDEKAALAEPLACGWHAARLASEALSMPLDEARAMVIGGGAIGLGAALVLNAQGCRDISIAEINSRRHKALADAGPFRIFNPMDTEAGGLDAHLVVDAYGGDVSREMASRAVRPGGVIVHIGLAGGSDGLDVRRMTLHEIVFIGTYTYTETDFAETAAAIFANRLGALDWYEQRDLADGPQAFEDIAQGLAAAPKIILKP